ncbi:MAG: dihydropteroate synthase [Pseudomonadales bacterium]|nr:dihydropteroate synthase [Pseudomonadales bacterium]
MNKHFLRCGDKNLDLSLVQVMGILNVTPDSFSDGGVLHGRAGLSLDLVLEKAVLMLGQGATILDVGGESTRPGAASVSEQQELDRVIPVIECIKKELDVVVSVDTSTAAVISEAGEAGVGLINDVRALQRDGAMLAAAKADLPVCLMHMQGAPATMQDNPAYQDILIEVKAFFDNRIQACVAAGIAKEKILLDPGFGFGKALKHNLTLLAELESIGKFGLPLLVGLSRKSMIGHVLDRAVDRRLPASLALAVMAVERGAKIIRVHDVQETVDAVRMAEAVMSVKC